MSSGHSELPIPANSQLWVLDTSRDQPGWEGAQEGAQQAQRLSDVSDATMLIVSSLQGVSSVSEPFPFLFQPTGCWQLLSLELLTRAQG